jgi:hypothetical protein
VLRLLLAGLCAALYSSAASPQDLVDRIREHMRDYISHLPDYTCRVTLERSTRRNARAEFALSDRLRLEVAYTGGRELYAWPGDARFEAGIADLLPGHGMGSEGSYAMHIRNLFVRSVATFSAPREERCGAAPCVRLEFHIPASLSGFYVSAGSDAAPAPLTGSAWFDPAALDILRLEVRVEDTPRSVRIASTRETTTYIHARIGDTEANLPATSELLLRDRNGTESRNYSTFDRYRRYSGTSTVFYGAGADPGADPSAPAPKSEPLPTGKELAATLDTALDSNAAIGDPVPVTTRDGAHLSARIVDMRRAGNRWVIVLRLAAMASPPLQLPLKEGANLSFRRTW